MAYWMYKCDSRGRAGRDSGDWDFVFSGEAKTWGRLNTLPELADLRKNDTVLAYQSNRNELVGTARVTGFVRKRGGLHLGIQPREAIGTKVRPLKKRDRRIAAIPALQQGPVKTLYEMSASDARYLLRKARLAVSRNRSRRAAGTKPDEERVSEYMRAAQGFEDDSQIRRALESAAVTRAKAYYRREGYHVREHGRPFDLFCRKRKSILYVEVKGSRTKAAKIWLTTNEVKFARANGMQLFILHSLKLKATNDGLLAFGGIRKVIAPWRPRNSQLKPVMYSYTIG